MFIFKINDEILNRLNEHINSIINEAYIMFGFKNIEIVGH